VSSPIPSLGRLVSPKAQGWRTYGKRHSLLFYTSYFFCTDQHLYIANNTRIYTHICVQIVYELPVLPKSTAVKHFTQIGVVQTVDWILSLGHWPGGNWANT
jgi:hypothetical protein